MNEAPDLRRAAVSGVLWQGASYLSGKLVVLASTVALARILAPAEFGLVALALVFIAYAEVATDLGVAQALVFLPKDRRRTDAALTLAVATSLVLVLAAMVAAPAVGRFFHRPDVAPLFRVMSLSLLIGAVGQVPDALLRRDLRFRRRWTADLARAGTQGGVSLALTLAGLGPWAIAYGYLAGGVAWSATLWALVDDRPGRRFWHFPLGGVRPLMAYGVPAAANALLLSLVFDIDYLIVGRRLGVRALGLYTLGFRLPELAIINVFYVLSAVAFPVFSRAREDPARLRRGYLTALRLQATYGMGAGVALATSAPMLVHVLFGERWAGAIVPLQALALYAAFRSLGMGAVDVLKGSGRPGLALTMALVRLGVLVPVLIVAARWGIEGVAVAQAFVALALAGAMQVVAARMLRLRLRTAFGAIVPALAVGAGMMAGGAVIRATVAGPELLRLALTLSAAVAGGLLASRLAGMPILSEVIALVARRPSFEPVASA